MSMLSSILDRKNNIIALVNWCVEIRLKNTIIYNLLYVIYNTECWYTFSTTLLKAIMIFVRHLMGINMYFDVVSATIRSR